MATLSRGGEKVRQLHSLSALCCLAGGDNGGQALLAVRSPMMSLLLSLTLVVQAHGAGASTLQLQF